jgi:hypothetical protein
MAELPKAGVSLSFDLLGTVTAGLPFAKTDPLSRQPPENPYPRLTPPGPFRRHCNCEED